MRSLGQVLCHFRFVDKITVKKGLKVVENCHQNPGNCGSTKQLSGQGEAIIHKLEPIVNRKS
jgi:hypothetical protein